MRTVFGCLLALLVLQAFAFSSAWGQQTPVPLQAVELRALVVANGNNVTYKYLVLNPAVNNGQIREIDIDLTQSAEQIQLSGDGLVNGPCYASQISQLTLQRVSMVPVGMDGPAGWVCILSSSGAQTGSGLASWGSEAEAFRILPGQTMGGFVLTSPGLPGIRSAMIVAAIDYDSLPDEFDDPQKLDALRASLTFQTIAVGPTAPSAGRSPIDILDHLIGLVDESRKLGWIRVDGVHQSLIAKLNDVRRLLVAGQFTQAAHVLQAFLQEVEAGSCRDFACRGSKPLTSDAYGLLFFNGKSLLGLLKPFIG